MKTLLRFITCGSVDDGKSTLIGRMLYDSKLIFSDQEKNLLSDSKFGSRNGKIDYSLLLDGLSAEREQGITIDVSYRYFRTKNRSFIVADTPGHEQYTRNMAVGASNVDLAIILVDSTKGILTQTKRHIRICSLMGIKNFVLAVNKIDLIDYNIEKFKIIKKQFLEFISDFNVDSVEVIPVSATEGDNIVDMSSNTLWYKGKTLVNYLEDIEIKDNLENDNFVMQVQRVSRPNYDFRGFQGQIQSGIINIGDKIITLPSEEVASVKSILVCDKNVQNAFCGQAVTIQLDKEIDISRGDIITQDNKKLLKSNIILSKILWMDDTDLVVGKNYILKLGSKVVNASISTINSKIDIDTGKKLPQKNIYKNDIVECEISISEKLVFDKFESLKNIGSFILIDRITNMTSACGIILDSVEKNIKWEEMDINKKLRSIHKNQNAITIWFTGLSGSGKTTLANALEKRLFSIGKHTMLLDGDNIRHGLNKNLGFSEQDRIENIRRIAEVSKLMNDAGIITITSFISPYESDRENAKHIIGKENFVEVYVSTSIEECEKRDVKGLYKKARNNEIINFTGIDSPYEIPKNSDIEIDTTNKSIDECVDKILNYIIDMIEFKEEN